MAVTTGRDESSCNCQIKEYLARKRGDTDMNIFYIIGVIVVVVVVAGFLGLR